MFMNKQFASVADLEEKEVSFVQLSEHCWAFTAEGDPNTGVIIGDDSVMIIDATATPVAAQTVVRKVREITDKPIKYVVLTHYHAVRVLGASGYKDHGLEQIIASQGTCDLIEERGQQDMDSEIYRFPRLFQSVESIPGLTWPTIVFSNEMSLMIGLAMLTVGNFLGGVWANESWGRYWGWDPKETWALVTILVYAVVVHLRFIKSLYSSFAYAVISLLAFTTVLMTYFGVNYYLAGMHSYAKGDPVPVPDFVPITYTIIFVIIVLAWRKRKIA